MPYVFQNSPGTLHLCMAMQQRSWQRKQSLLFTDVIKPSYKDWISTVKLHSCTASIFRFPANNNRLMLHYSLLSEMHGLFTLYNGTVPAKKESWRIFKFLRRKDATPFLMLSIDQFIGSSYCFSMYVRHQNTDSNNHKLAGLYFPTVKWA
jgi:hypothetical protein